MRTIRAAVAIQLVAGIRLVMDEGTRLDVRAESEGIAIAIVMVAIHCEPGDAVEWRIGVARAVGLSPHCLP